MWYLWRKRQVNSKFWCTNLRERYQLEDLDVGCRAIFKCIFRKYDDRHLLDWSGSVLGQLAGC